MLSISRMAVAMIAQPTKAALPIQADGLGAGARRMNLVSVSERRKTRCSGKARDKAACKSVT